MNQSLASDSRETVKVFIICSIIPENFPAMPFKFAVKIDRLHGFIIFSQSDYLDLQSRSQLRLKDDKSFNSYFNSNISGSISALGIHTGHGGRLTHGIHAHVCVDDLDLGARAQWVGRGNNSALNNHDHQAINKR